MTKPIELSHSQWNKLYHQLCLDYPRSVMIIRSRMQAKLGFTNREYKDWDNNMGKVGSHWRKNCVMLDFYSESKRTFFMIKYSDYIQKD